MVAPIIERSVEVDKGHGRVEMRTVELSRDLSWLSDSERWLALDFFVRVERERTTVPTGKVSTETAYYIGSNKSATAESASLQKRRHSWKLRMKCTGCSIWLSEKMILAIELAIRTIS